METNNVVLMSMAGSAIIVVADDVRTSGIKGTHLLALGVVFIAVNAAADVSPKVGVPFALLVFATVALTKGANVLNAIADTTSPTNKKSNIFPKYGTNPSSFVPKKGG